jgi:hypothetical protein
MYRRLLIAGTLALLICAAVTHTRTTNGPIEISGQITTTTWFSPTYHVTGPCTVSTGNTLTIDPGVDVLFDADVPFVVEGKLVALGTETDSIRFLKGTAEEGGGIRIFGGDTNTMKYVRVSDAYVAKPSEYTSAEGGGIRLEDARLGMSHCVVSGNSVEGRGGGMFAKNATVSLDTCIVTRNAISMVSFAAGTGGGIFAESTTLIAQGSVISQNLGIEGGGLYIDGILPTVLHSTRIDSNTSTLSGGGMNITSSPSFFTNCTIDGNVAGSTPGTMKGLGRGGAILASGSNLTLIDCKIRNNTSDEWCAGVNVGGTSILRLDNCELSHNVAWGAAVMDVYNSTNTIMNDCIVFGNRTTGSADDCNGAGPAFLGGTTKLTGCTIADNVADVVSPIGIWCLQRNKLELKNCIIWGHTGGDVDLSDPKYGIGSMSVTYSDIGSVRDGAYSGVGNISADPMFVDPDAGDYRLQPGVSPCINAGDPASPTDPDGSRADMGAVSCDGCEPATADFTDISGRITTAVWTPGMGPYHVTAKCTVAANNSLTIEPGVDVLFDADVGFVVEGRLIALGTEADSIRFLKGTTDEWGGIRISGGDSSTMRYVRVSDGHADAPFYLPESKGGGIYVGGSRLGMTNSVVTGNTAVIGGGICVVEKARISISKCRVSHNTSTSTGGALSISHATVCADSSVFAHNTAAGGAGFYSEYSDIDIVGCDISDNAAGKGGPNAYGGGIHTIGDKISLTDCEINRNYSNYYGGGVHINGSTISFVRCVIDSNQAETYYGGGVSSSRSPGKVDFLGCVLKNNIARGGAATALFGYDAITMVNCLVVRNWSELESCGVDFHSPDFTMVNCTVADNISVGYEPCDIKPEDSWGFITAHHPEDTVKIINSIIWGHAGYDVYQLPEGLYCSTSSTIHPQGSIIAPRHSNIGTANTSLDGLGMIALDPMFVDPANGNYSLQPGVSPCIDTGDPRILDNDSSVSDMGYNPNLNIHTVPWQYTSVTQARRPGELTLMQNYPNPFNPTTTIRFSLPESGPVRLSIYNIQGQLVRNLVKRTLNAGYHSVRWDGNDTKGRNMASGLYICRLEADGQTIVRRMTLVR